MQKVSLVMCADMHMDIEQANEILSSILNNGSYRIETNYKKADIIIIMTCAFGERKKYSMHVIADVQRNCANGAKIIVTGCLAKLKYEELSAIPGIEVKTFQEVKSLFGETKINTRLVAQNSVIISRGCLKRCSYCVYPLIENKYVSKPMEDIMAEVEEMYQSEINIYITGAHETSDYGIDLYGTHKFPELMDNICTKFPNCNYIIGWFHPVGLTDEFLQVASKYKNIVGIMVHIQHVSNHILKNMNRPPFEFTNERLKKLKSLRPDIKICTEVIVGYPGETEKEFEELINYLDQGMFADIGVASYEPVLGTKGATLPNLPLLKVRNQRMEEIGTRYGGTKYPAPGNEFEPILQSYFEACEFLEKIPKMIVKPEVMQEYELIAEVDTLNKRPDNLQPILFAIFEEIVNARDKVSIEKHKKAIAQHYTEEFRKYMFELMKNADLKQAIIAKAKNILIEN